MAIHFTCRACAKDNEFTDQLAGCVVECPECKRNLVLPPDPTRSLRSYRRSYWGVGSCVLCAGATVMALWSFWSARAGYDYPPAIVIVLGLYLAGLLFAAQGHYNPRENPLWRTGLIANGTAISTTAVSLAVMVFALLATL